MPLLRIVYLILGTISLILGIVGIFLPLLPTTPFLLLTAFLYHKSSRKVYERLMAQPVIGKYIRDFRENKLVPVKVKITSIILLWITIPYCIFFVVENLAVRILLGVVMIGVSVHILLFKSK